MRPQRHGRREPPEDAVRGQPGRVGGRGAAVRALLADRRDEGVQNNPRAGQRPVRLHRVRVAHVRGHRAGRHEQARLPEQGDQGELGDVAGQPAEDRHDEPPPHLRGRPLARDRDADAARGVRPLRRDLELPHRARPADAQVQGVRVRVVREEGGGGVGDSGDERTVAGLALHPHQLVHQETARGQARGRRRQTLQTAHLRRGLQPELAHQLHRLLRGLRRQLHLRRAHAVHLLALRHHTGDPHLQGEGLRVHQVRDQRGGHARHRNH